MPSDVAHSYVQRQSQDPGTEKPQNPCVVTDPGALEIQWLTT